MSSGMNRGSWTVIGKQLASVPSMYNLFRKATETALRNLTGVGKVVASLTVPFTYAVGVSSVSEAADAIVASEIDMATHDPASTRRRPEASALAARRVYELHSVKTYHPRAKSSVLTVNFSLYCSSPPSWLSTDQH